MRKARGHATTTVRRFMAGRIVWFPSPIHSTPTLMLSALRSGPRFIFPAITIWGDVCANPRFASHSEVQTSKPARFERRVGDLAPQQIVPDARKVPRLPRAPAGSTPPLRLHAQHRQKKARFRSHLFENTVIKERSSR